MMKIVHGVAAKVFTREFAFGRCRVKRMRQQVVPGDPRIKLFAEFLSIHLCSFGLNRDTAGYAKQKDRSTLPESRTQRSGWRNSLGRECTPVSVLQEVRNDRVPSLRFGISETYKMYRDRSWSFTISASIFFT